MTIWHHRQIFIKFGPVFGYCRWRISFSLYHSVSVRFASFASPYFSYPNKIFNQLVVLWLAFPNEATAFFEELKQQIQQLKFNALCHWISDAYQLSVLVLIMRTSHALIFRWKRKTNEIYLKRMFLLYFGHCIENESNILIYWRNGKETAHPQWNTIYDETPLARNSLSYCCDQKINVKKNNIDRLILVQCSVYTFFQFNSLHVLWLPLVYTLPVFSLMMWFILRQQDVSGWLVTSFVSVVFFVFCWHFRWISINLGRASAFDCRFQLFKYCQ